jgi:hypothetical protein
MNRVVSRLISAPILLLVAVLTLSCGGGNNQNRMLELISVSPTVANAQNGQAQFVATGTFSAPPVTVNPLPVNWIGPPLPLNLAVCAPDFCPGINSQGLATCGLSFSGTVTITASAPRDPKLPLYTQNVPMVTGTATLNCP